MVVVYGQFNGGPRWPGVIRAALDPGPRGAYWGAGPGSEQDVCWLPRSHSSYSFRLRVLRRLDEILGLELGLPRPVPEGQAVVILGRARAVGPTLARE
jgi:hypothetical protein